MLPDLSSFAKAKLSRQPVLFWITASHNRQKIQRSCSPFSFNKWSYASLHPDPLKQDGVFCPFPCHKWLHKVTSCNKMFVTRLQTYRDYALVEKTPRTKSTHSISQLDLLLFQRLRSLTQILLNLLHHDAWRDKNLTVEDKTGFFHFVAMPFMFPCRLWRIESTSFKMEVATEMNSRNQMFLNEKE